MKCVRAVLDKVKINHAGKTLQSLRHCVETRLGYKMAHQKIADAIFGHVLDNLKGNSGDNQQVRANKSIKYRYFRGNEERAVLEALNLIGK